MNIETIDQYLRDQGCTLWGRSFDIVSPDSREQAVLFLKNVIDDLNKVELNQWRMQDRLPYA